MNKDTQNKEVNKFAPKGRVKNIKGTIVAPENSGLRFILSNLNLGGKPEGELYELFDKKWRKVREEAKGWHASRNNFKLGSINTTAVQSDVWVINMLCQDADNKVDEKALDLSLKKIVDLAKYEKANIHISSLLLDAVPGLADKIESCFVDNGLSVSIYDEV